ncbi:hypothetical protein ACTHGU_06420 [Chitinophagaceae bacterium MMS25-I14]
MISIRLGVIAFVLCIVSGTAIAQKVKLEEGDLGALKGVKNLNVQYDYSNMTVTTKNIPEADFIKQRTEEYNQKEAGKGDKWAQSWVADRKGRFEGQYKEQFEKQSDFKIGNMPNEKYTMIVKTTHTELGFNIGITRRNAYIDAEVWIVETANPGHVVAKITLDNCPGRTFGGYDFDTGERLQEAYAMAGKAAAKFINKKM